MQVSVKMDEIMSEIISLVRKKLHLGKNIKLSYTSNTTFLTFEASEVKKNRDRNKH